MTATKQNVDGPTPPATPDNPVHTPSQADAAHIATAEYQRELKAGVDRIARLKALRLAQATKPKPKKSKPKAVKGLDRPKSTRRPRWGR